MIVLACGLAVLALPAGALASPPGKNQYVTPNPSATGSGHARPDGTQSAVPAGSSSGDSGSAAVPILVGGAVVVGGAGALILYRRRRSGPSPPE